MKNFIAVVAATSDGRLAKYQDFATLAEAESHVEAVLDSFPKAFAATNPGGGFADWLIDIDAKTIILDPLPPDPGPTLDELYDDVMKNQRVLKALALCLNDGTIIPGANVSGAILKAAIKVRM